MLRVLTLCRFVSSVSPGGRGSFRGGPRRGGGSRGGGYRGRGRGGAPAPGAPGAAAAAGAGAAGTGVGSGFSPPRGTAAFELFRPLQLPPGQEMTDVEKGHEGFRGLLRDRMMGTGIFAERGHLEWATDDQRELLKRSFEGDNSNADKELEERTRNVVRALIPEMDRLKPLVDEGSTRGFLDLGYGRQEGVPFPMSRIVVVDVGRCMKTERGGRVMSFNALVVGGNGKGLGGFGFGKGKTGGNAIQRGMMDMFKNLHFHDLYGRTIPHIVSAENTKTEVVLRPAKTSRGIKAHRAIAAICQCLGIFDISAKVTGRREEHNVVRATFKALRKLESPQDAALRRGMQIIDLSRQGPPLPTPLEEAIASQQRADKDRQRRWEERKATVGSKPWDTGFRQNRRRPSGDRARW